jgi:hypothetical protein
MTEVLQSSPSHHFPSPSSSTSTPCVVSTNDVDIPHQHQQQHRPHNRPREILDQEEESKEREREGDQVSIVELLVAAFRRSIVGCSVTASTGSKDLCRMEIGVPTNVRHVAHVTFDRFNGFLGLPVEFEPEVPRRAPSARLVLEGNLLGFVFPLMLN